MDTVQNNTGVVEGTHYTVQFKFYAVISMAHSFIPANFIQQFLSAIWSSSQG
jgi:hypothetical protein